VETTTPTRARLAADARLVVQAWLGTRLVLVITATAVALVTGRGFVDVLANWDVQHFVFIAQYGYAKPTEVAFFPGLPLVLRGGMLLGLDPVIAGTIVSVVTSALATWALYRLGGRWAAIAWLLAPTSVFTLVPYSESPFCAAAFWAWERATQRKWAAASVLAAAACTLRVSGLFLVGALFVLAVWQWWGSRGGRWAAAYAHPDAVGARPDPAAPGATASRSTARVARAASPDRLSRSLPWLLPPLAVLGAYAIYLYRLTGSWTAWFSAQATGWMRQLTMPWDCVVNSWRAIQPGMYADHPGWVWIFRAEFASIIIGVIVVALLLWRRRVPEASWVGVQVFAFSLSYWFQSVCRALLIWFPLWTLLGGAVERRRTGVWLWIWPIAVFAALCVQIAWAVLFYLGMWAG